MSLTSRFSPRAALVGALALVLVSGASSTARAQAAVHRVLLVIVNGFYNGDGNSIATALTAAGADVDTVVLNANGVVAAALAANTYDQLWVYDLSQFADNYPADWDAIAAWYQAADDPEIICDGRIISSYWHGHAPGEGLTLTENYYENLRIRGGGLVLGTDHNVYQNGINAINARIGLNPFFGAYNLLYIPVDTANPLMSWPNDLGPQLWDDSSPGSAPYNLQPNGRILYSVAWHSGNVNTPGITSTIEGVVGLHVTVTSPPDGTALCEGPLPFSAEGTGGIPPYSFEWSSDLDGPLGAGDSLPLDAADLSVGSHLVTVTITDQQDLVDTDTIEVVIENCPVDCVVSEWSDWSACSVTCGGGSRTRTRAVLVPAQYGGAECPALVEIEPCNPEPCPIDCVVSEWSEWSACSAACGDGVRTRTRQVLVAPQHGGAECPALLQDEPCNLGPCEVDCVVGGWSEWSACDAACGGGVQFRTRPVVVEPQNGGLECPVLTEMRACNTQPCPIDCVVGEWSEWSACDAVCEAGGETRTRAILVAPAYGGAACPPLEETRPCLPPDADGDGIGDDCDFCPLDAANDDDGDGVCGDVDACPGTVLPEDVPTIRLNPNHYADVDGDGVFDTTPAGGGPPRPVYTLVDTRGCGCRQIIDALGLGNGHVKFGCSPGVMAQWVGL